MDMFILLTVLLMLSSNKAYDFICPSHAHWHIRAKSMCDPPKNYTCLFNVTFRVNVYRDICNRPRLLGQGYKYVFQPNLNRAPCSVNRYQPFIFDTNGYSNCTYQKSPCNSIGQETYENGNSTVDRKCICNTDREYTFITKSQDQCYCSPSTEDCSCYLGINAYNKTIGLKGIKCSDDLKMTRSHYLENMLNISRTITIVEFDNFKYNLNYVPTKTYRIIASISILTLFLANFAVCAIVHRFITWIHVGNASIAINQLSEEDKVRYKKLMQTSKTENRYFVRIMIVGKESAGKTCLLRRLLKESISDVSSTDGVDIVVRRCKINIENGKWIIGKDIDDDKMNRIDRALAQNADDRHLQYMQVDEKKNTYTSHRDEMSIKKRDITIDSNVSLDKSEDTNESSSLVMPDDLTNDIKAGLHSHEETRESSSLVMIGDCITDAHNSLNRYKDANESSSLVIQGDLTTDVKNILDYNEYADENSTFFILEDLTADVKDSLHKFEVENVFSEMVMPGDLTADAKDILDKNEDTNESSLLVMPEDLMSHVFSRSTVNTPLNLFALCELWDFAGQKDYYATHQAFLTSSAIYLVVADMKDDISKQGLDQCFAAFEHVGEYVDFWFDSIHCHRTTDRPPDYGHFDPPILLVFTGKDKYDNEAEFKNRRNELVDQINHVFGYQSKFHHLHETFYVSNKMNTEEEFEKLRYKIYESARKMNDWGNAFPLKWILLEHLIEINKNNGKNFITFNDMFKLAKHRDINILNEDELLLFLRFQHNVGNIIFFTNIRDLIILKPQWLADAFRCLVSNRFDNSNLHHREDWTLFTRQGKISEDLITELFKSKGGRQFSGQEQNLNKIMEKLDILVKIEDSSYYIMPSQMPSSTFEDVCEKFGILKKNCKRTSWLCFKFEFLPPSFFNHISSWFIRTYNPSKVDRDIALYRGICMFDIDKSCCEKILVTMSTDTIALQIVSFLEHQEFGPITSYIYDEVKKLIEEIIERYKVKISFTLHFKCSDGDYHKDTFPYETLITGKECFCPQHQKTHRAEKMYSVWMKNKVQRVPDDEEKQNDLIPSTDLKTAVERDIQVDVPTHLERECIFAVRRELIKRVPDDEEKQNDLNQSTDFKTAVEQAKEVDVLKHLTLEPTFEEKRELVQRVPDDEEIQNDLIPSTDFKTAVEQANEVDVVKHLTQELTFEEKRELVSGGDNFHPIYTVCKNGSAGVLRELLEYADTQALEKKDKGSKSTPLQIAVKKKHSECVDLLLSHNVNKDVVNGLRQSAVHIAVQGRDLITLCLLRKYNCDVNAKDTLGDSPVIDAIAIQRDSTEMLDVILDWPEIDLNIENKNGFSPIHIAARKGDLRAVQKLLKKDKKLLNKKKRDGYTALHLASCLDHHQVVQYLLDQPGIDINARTIDKGQTSLLIACFYGSRKSAEILLGEKYNCQIDISDSDGNNALHLCLSGPSIIEMSGKQIVRDNDKRIKQQLDLAELLVNKGVSYNVRNNNGKLPQELPSAGKLKQELAIMLNSSQIRQY